MSDEQFEFLMAMEEYKRLNAKPFPTWTEVLEVIKALGYSKVGPSTNSGGHRAAAEAGQDDPAPSDSRSSR
jgi:hypothetical protein